MADNSELDYLITFIDEVTTALTVNSYETKRNIEDVAGAKKCLIYPGELLSSDGAFYRKRYLVKLSLENEANMMSIINEIINGTIAYNKRSGSYTYPDVMCNIKFIYTNKSFVSSNGRWNQDVYIDVEWSTS